MKRSPHRSPRAIVVTAALLYAVVVAVAWRQGTRAADDRANTILVGAERGFTDVIYGEINAVIRYMGGAVINRLGDRCRPQEPERMEALASDLNLDEINVVRADGLVIGSNVASVRGTDFNAHPLTREFMALTNASVTRVTQPFRFGIDNSDAFCKYYGIPFPARDGFLQIGVSADRLRRNMYDATEAESAQELRDWHFSVEGWYERADGDPDFADGREYRRRDAASGRTLVCRDFTFLKFRYRAVLPEDYCYSQRNSTFAVTALTLAALLAAFTFFLVRLAVTSDKVEQLHDEAAARTADDLALAKTIQLAALPAVAGALPDRLEFAHSAESRPAKEVGGDFYDFYPVSGGRLALVVADVSGKGIPAAMFMMEAKNVIKNCLTEFDDAGEAVEAANARLCSGNDAEMFVTAWVGLLDPATGTVEYVNAGHNRPFVRRADGSVEKVCGKGGPFLGLFEGVGYQTHRLALEPGDRLFLYTDGITEAMDAHGRLFGERRLCEALSTGAVTQAVRDFVGAAEQSDDMTTLSVDWYGEPVRTERAFACAEESLGPAVDFIRAAISGFDRRRVAEALNAADEVVSNVVNYSESAGFRIAVARGRDRVRLVISDSGRPYNPLSHADPDVHAAIDDRPVGGLGLVMVKRLVDRVTYARDGEDNVLALVKTMR